jgi:hypothetical protein
VGLNARGAGTIPHFAGHSTASRQRYKKAPPGNGVNVSIARRYIIKTILFVYPLN